MKNKINSSTFYTHSSLSNFSFLLLQVNWSKAYLPFLYPLANLIFILKEAGVHHQFHLSWWSLEFSLNTSGFSFQALPYLLEVTGCFLSPGNGRSDVCHLWTDPFKSSVITYHISFSCGNECGSLCQDRFLNDYEEPGSAVNLYTLSMNKHLVLMHWDLRIISYCT